MHLSDGHGAENVEEDEGAVCCVTAHEIAVGQILEYGERSERQLSHHMPVKPGNMGMRPSVLNETGLTEC